MSIGSFQNIRIGSVNFPKMRGYRVDRLREAMKTADVDVLLVQARQPLRYMTDMRYCDEVNCDIRGNAGLLFAKGGDPTLFAVTGDWKWATLRMDWLEEIIPNRVAQSIGWPEPLKTLCEVVVSVLKKHDVRSGKLAVDEFSPSWAELLKQSLPGLDVVSGRPILDEATAIKSEDEIKLMKIAGSILDGGMNLVLDWLKPGNSENEIAGELIRYLYKKNIDYLEWNPQIQTGENTVPYLRYSTDRIIQPNDTFYADFGICYSGYAPGIARFGFLGKPTAEQKKLYKAVSDCVQTMLKMTKPGVASHEIYEAGEKVLEEAGYKKWAEWSPWMRGGVMASGFGTTHGGELPHFRALGKGEKPLKLQKNMAIRYEPGYMIPGVGGGRCKGECIVRDYGAEVLTTTPPWDGTNPYE